MVYPIYPTAYHFNAVQNRTPRHGQSQTPSNNDPDAFQRQLAEQPKPDTTAEQSTGQPKTGTDNPGNASVHHGQATYTSDTAAHSTQKSIQGQPIGIDDIVKDVEGTMDALGADETTRQDVALYLKAVQHQASQRKPSKAFIQESLKVIGHRLDRFIGDALKQPSTVVNEWVNALLLQPIDYKTKQGRATATTHNSGSAATVSATALSSASGIKQNPPSQPTPETKAPETKTTDNPTLDIQPELLAAQQQARLGNTDGALATLQQLLGKTELNARQTGTIYLTQAAIYEQAQQTTQAQQAYQNALQYPLGGKATIQAHAQLASLLEHTGQTPLAIQHYQQGIHLAQQAASQPQTATAAAKLLAQLENDLGSLLFIAEQPEQAQTHLSNARQWAIKADKPLLPDIYSNLAHVWQALDNPTQRNQAFLKGMNAAKRLGDQSGYLNLLAQYQQHVAA